MPKYGDFKSTKRNWHQMKRAELRELIKALDVFRLGCAYTPAYADVLAIEKALSSAKQKMSLREWGR